jgi:RNA polymerase sigma-70 factor (ECF subfamily)
VSAAASVVVDDHELADRAIAGDQAAVTTLVRRHRANVERTIARFRLAVADADDCVQDTLIQIATKLQSWNRDAKLSTWVYRVASNVALMRLRTGRRRPAGDDIDDMEIADHRALAADEVIARGEELARVRVAMLQLTDRERSALEGFYRDGLTLREVAEAHGSTETAMKSLIFRVRGKVRDALLEPDAPPPAPPRHVPRLEVAAHVAAPSAPPKPATYLRVGKGRVCAICLQPGHYAPTCGRPSCVRVRVPRAPSPKPKLAAARTIAAADVRDLPGDLDLVLACLDDVKAVPHIARRLLKVWRDRITGLVGGTESVSGDRAIAAGEPGPCQEKCGP